MLWQAFGRWGGIAGSTDGGGGLTTDPYWTSVKLLVGANGTNGSTTVPDESSAAHGNATISGLNNDAQLSTGFKKFGTASLAFDGNNDVAVWADHDDWSFGSGDFTVETWALFHAGALEANSPLIAHWDGGTNQREWILVYRGDSATNVVEFSVSSAGTAADLTVNTSAWTPTADTWYHIAADRSGNVFRVYVDGVMLGKSTTAITLNNSTFTLRMGNVGGSTSLIGKMDETRITKGVARYASDSGYSVPTAAFPRS